MLDVDLIDSVTALDSSDRALVLFSGGFDSACVTLDVLRQGLDTTLLSFDFMDRPSNEIAAARSLSAALGTTLLEDRLPVRDARSGQFGELAPMYEAWMPHRNIIFLSVAMNIAAAEGFGVLAIGIRCSDAPAYSDSSPRFLRRLVRLMATDGLPDHPSGSLRIYCPLLRNHNLARELLLAPESAALLDMTRSCWRRANPPCGECVPCKFRARFDMEVRG